VGHNVQIGRGCILSGQAGIAGSARLRDYVVVAGQAGVAGHLEVGAGSQVAAKSAVLQTVPAGRKVAGIPAVDLAEWRRAASVFPRLGELVRRVRKLEKRLEKLTRESSY
jgi:UDP-3-O-[3-hydroxymyristoyl] glucosamine N-acyltransferase